MCFRRPRVQRQGLVQQRFDLIEIEPRVLGSLALPQTHGIVVMRPGVAGLEFREAAEAGDDIVGLAGELL